MNTLRKSASALSRVLQRVVTMAEMGRAVVVAAQMRQASRSFNVGNGEFQAKQWMAPNPQAKSRSRSTGTVLATNPGTY